MQDNHQFAHQLSVYPNPTVDHIMVDLTSTQLSAIQKVEILDMSGKVLIDLSENYENRRTLRIPTSRLANGMYMLQLVDDSGQQVSKKFFKS